MTGATLNSLHRCLLLPFKVVLVHGSPPPPADMDGAWDVRDSSDAESDTTGRSASCSDSERSAEQRIVAEDPYVHLSENGVPSDGDLLSPGSRCTRC